LDSSISKELKVGDPLPYDLILAKGQMTFPKGTAITPDILRIINSGNVVQVTFDTPLGERITDSAPKTVVKTEPVTQSGKNLAKALILNQARAAIISHTAISDDPLEPVLAELSGLWSDPSMQFQMPSIVSAVNQWVESLTDMQYVPASVGWHPVSGNFIPAHMVDVARMASAIGVELGFETGKLSDLAYAGLMHDIGELFIERELLMRNGDLSQPEINKLRQHPRQSVEWLKRAGLESESVQRLVLRHHERFDGSGYPFNITQKVLGDDDCILALCDVYCAMIAARPHRRAFTRRGALKAILSQKDLGFPAKLVNQFASVLGLYPPGSVVKLKSGDIAVALQSSKNSKWRALLINTEPESESHEEIDLNNLSGDYIIGEIA